MRRKDLTYYTNTILLKLANRRFLRIKDEPSYREKISQDSVQLQEAYNRELLAFPEFSIFYRTYYYFSNTDIFSENYIFHDGFPTGLRKGNDIPLIPMYFGLVHINSAFNSEEFDRALMVRIAEYIIDKSQLDGGVRILTHDFEYSLFGLNAPWISGITQAIAVSFFLRLYVVTKEEKYLDYAKAFFAACESADHCLAVTENGLEWVEEYNGSAPAYVLSGHIFAIIAAGELYQITKEDRYKFHTENWLRSVIGELRSYQYKGYLVHNKLQWKLSNIEYQGLYVGQFLHLYELTGNDVFLGLHKYYESKISWKRFNRFYGIRK